jgi:hypothetical protein
LHWLYATHQQGHGRLPADVTIYLADPHSAYKPLGEAALAVSLVLRDGLAGSHDIQAARGLIDSCWQQLHDGNLFYERRLRLMTLTDPLELYAHFTRAGYRHRLLDGLLTDYAGLRAPDAVEIVPNRRLAVAKRPPHPRHRPAARLGGARRANLARHHARTVGGGLEHGLRHHPHRLPPHRRGLLPGRTARAHGCLSEGPAAGGQWDLVTELLTSTPAPATPCAAPSPGSSSWRSSTRTD